MDVLHVRAALAAELPSGAEPPREILLVPAGEVRMRPHDGREPFHNPDPAAVVAASRELRLDLPIDYEHQMDRSKENGQPAPAAGWIKQLFERAGAVWGEVEWTERATAMIAAKEYRFISPVFLHDKARTVKAVLGAALTNDPAMFMQALARASASTTEGRMDPKELRAALCLPAEATDEQVIAAAKAAAAAATGLKAVAKAAGLAETATADEVETKVKATASARQPDPEAYVPRAEFDRVSQRLNTVETERAEERATAAVDAAVTAGKIAPAQRDWAGDYAAADGGVVIGVTRNDVAKDARAAVDIQGRLEVETTAAAIAVGDAVMSDDAGKALKRTGAHYIAGYAVTAVPAAGGIVQILRGI